VRRPTETAAASKAKGEKVTDLLGRGDGEEAAQWGAGGKLVVGENPES